MLKRGVCGVDLRHQVVVIGFLYTALAIFGFVFGFMVLQNPEYFANKATARQRDWEVQEEQRLDDTRLENEEELNQILSNINQENGGDKGKLKSYDPLQESQWKDPAEKPAYQEDQDKGELIKDLDKLTKEQKEKQEETREEETTAIESEKEGELVISDPDPIPDDLASYRNNAGQETENTSNEEEEEGTNDNTDYDYESLSEKDSSSQIETAVTNEVNDQNNIAAYDSEDSEENDNDDEIEKEADNNGGDSEDLGSDVQNSIVAEEKVNNNESTEEENAEENEESFEQESSTVVQNSEADPATNSKKLHRFYVLLNYIQKEGVEVMIASLLKFVCSALLIMGARRGWAWFLVPWLVEEVFEMVGGMLQLITNAVREGSMTFGSSLLMMGIYLLGGYFIYSVASYHFLLKRMSKQSMEVISSVSQGNLGGFQVGLNYQRLDEDVCWQAEPNLAMEFKDRESGFVRESRLDVEENDDYVLYVK